MSSLAKQEGFDGLFADHQSFLTKSRDSEKEILDVVISQCARLERNETALSSSVVLEFENGIRLIKRFGFDVLDSMQQSALSGLVFPTNKPFGNRAIAAMYTISYNLINGKVGYAADVHGRALYNAIVNFIKQHLDTTAILTVLQFDTTSDYASTLKKIAVCWQSFKITMKCVCLFFSHTHDSVVAFNGECSTLVAIGLVNFYSMVFSHRLQDTIPSAMIGFINNARDEEKIVDYCSLAECVEMLLMMGIAKHLIEGNCHGETINGDSEQLNAHTNCQVPGIRAFMLCKLTSVDSALHCKEYTAVYEEVFENQFIKATAAYFEQTMCRLIDECPLVNYLSNATKTMKESETLTRLYLTPKSTQPRLCSTVLVRCAVDHQEQIFAGVQDLLVSIFNIKNIVTNEFGATTPQWSIACECRSEVAITELYGLCVQIHRMSMTEEIQAQVAAAAGVAHILKLDDWFSMTNKLCKEFKNYVMAQGEAILAEVEADISGSTGRVKIAALTDTSLMDKLVSFVLAMHTMAQTLFESDSGFYQAMKDALTVILNQQLSNFSFAQLLAAYCDALLRGTPKLTDVVLAERLSVVIQIFRFFRDKDLFAEQYRILLSKRLLQQKTISIDFEKVLIGLLKAECGGQFTSKLEGMLSDLAVSADITSEYDAYFRNRRKSLLEASIAPPMAPLTMRMTRRSLGQQQQQQQLPPSPVAEFSELQHGSTHQLDGLLLTHSAIEFKVTILTMGHWPTARLQDTIVVPPLRDLQQHFSAWYSHKYSNRVLKWALSLGEAVMTMTMPDGKTYEILMLPLQAAVLHLFHDRSESFCITDVQSHSGIAELEVLKRVLHSLCCQRYQILLKSSDTKSIALTDTFTHNPAFSNNVRRFRLVMASMDDSGTAGGGADAAQAAARKSLMEDRGFLIDSIVVRTMKARRRLSHTELLGEIVRQIDTFRPDPVMIKARIGSLIERDFLERAEGDVRTYIYVP